MEEEKVGTPSSASRGNNGSDQCPASVSPRARIVSVASNIASQPLHDSDPRVWGVLTAISNNARKRHQVSPFFPVLLFLSSSKGLLRTSSQCFVILALFKSSLLSSRIIEYECLVFFFFPWLYVVCLNYLLIFLITNISGESDWSASSIPIMVFLPIYKHNVLLKRLKPSKREFLYLWELATDILSVVSVLLKHNG